MILGSLDRAMIPTGLFIELPEGYELTNTVTEDKKDKDDDDDEVKWKITDSKTYSGKDDAFKGIKAYISDKMEGNEDKVSKMAIVEVKYWPKSDKDKASYMYFTCIKVKGNWYILKYQSGGKATKIKTIANSWAEYADKK